MVFLHTEHFMVRIPFLVCSRIVPLPQDDPVLPILPNPNPYPPPSNRTSPQAISTQTKVNTTPDRRWLRMRRPTDSVRWRSIHCFLSCSFSFRPAVGGFLVGGGGGLEIPWRKGWAFCRLHHAFAFFLHLVIASVVGVQGVSAVSNKD